MASIPGGVSVTGFIAPNDVNDQYPVTDDIYGKGGYRVVQNITERDAITDLRRKEGMMVHVIDTVKTYQLIGGLTNAFWQEFSGGSSGPSEPAEYSEIILTSGEDIGGNRAVKQSIIGAAAASTLDDLVDESYCLGISTGAVLSGNDVTIRTRGKMTEPSWSWTIGLPIFFNELGVLTQAPGTSGYIQELGIALSATEILIEIKQPILR